MSYNGSGTFLINSTGNPVVTGTTISSTWANNLAQDLATGLSTAITKDGQTTVTNNIPLGGNKITGLANGTDPTDAAAFGQLSTFGVRGYISGLTLSAAGGSATFGIAAGIATDSTNAAMMNLASAYTKTTSSWAVGTGNGSLDTGSIANATWYHVYLIERLDTGVTDILTSTSASSPTLPTNYTVFRRIGSMLTDGSAHWVKFVQLGNDFLLSTPVSDISVVNLGNTGTLYTLTVPLGIQVDAEWRAFALNAIAGTQILLSSPDETDVTPGNVTGNVTIRIAVDNSLSAGTGAIRTNTSSQIRARSNSASTTLGLVTSGWIDSRGQNA